MLKRVAEKIFSGVPLYSITKLSKSRTGTPLINIKDIVSNNIQTEGIPRFDCGQFKNLERYIVVPGDILVTCRGTQLKIAIVPDYLEKALIASNLIAIRLRKDVLPIYLATYLRSVQGQKKLLSRTSSSGMSLMLNISDLDEIEIPVPPVFLQAKIGNIASTVERYYQLTLESANLCKTVASQLINDILNREDYHGKVDKQRVK